MRLTCSRIVIPTFIPFAGLLALSCASTITHRLDHYSVVSYADHETAPSRVALLLTTDFQNFVFEEFSYGDMHRYSIGHALAENAERLGGALFSDLRVTRGENVPKDAGLAGVLVPKALVFRPIKMMGWEESITTVSLEWTLQTVDGQIVWATTAEGEARGPLGSSFSYAANTEKYLSEALTAAFRKSYERMRVSEELRSIGRALH